MRGNAYARSIVADTHGCVNHLKGHLPPAAAFAADRSIDISGLWWMGRVSLIPIMPQHRGIPQRERTLKVAAVAVACPATETTSDRFLS